MLTTLLAGVIGTGVHLGITEAAENARLEKQVGALDDIANQLLRQLAGARAENERLTKLAAAGGTELGAKLKTHEAVLANRKD